jgi:hypothetical protein
VSVPSLGIAEARSCLFVSDKWLGSRLFSIKRFISSGVAFVLFITIYYVLIEIRRAEIGLEWRPPFSGPHMGVNPVIGVAVGAMSFSINIFILRISIRLFENLRFSNIYFFISLLLTLEANQIFFI